MIDFVPESSHFHSKSMQQKKCFIHEILNDKNLWYHCLFIYFLSANNNNNITLLAVCKKDITCTGLIAGLHPDNERRHYKETQSLIGWAQT